MSGETTISVNFGRPMPLFPLDGLVLMPHGVFPLHIFEPRYRQMVTDALDGAGQIAMAMFDGEQWTHEYHGRPAVRPIVCVGQIIQHMKLPDGRYAIVLQGLCRARIVEEMPSDEEILYRRAMLEPVDLGDADEDALEPFRQRVVEAIEHDKLKDLRGSQGLLEHLKNPTIPTSALMEVLGFTFLSDNELRYRLLACENALERARLVSGELMGLQQLLRRAAPQRSTDAPKGCCWN